MTVHHLNTNWRLRTAERDSQPPTRLIGGNERRRLQRDSTKRP